MSSQPTEALQPEQPQQPEQRRLPHAPWLLGVIGVAFAGAAGVLQVLGIVQASNLNWEGGTLLAWLAIGMSVAALLVGVAAIVLNRGRRWGAVAVAAALVANPWVLAQLLGALG